MQVGSISNLFTIQDVHFVNHTIRLVVARKAPRLQVTRPDLEHIRTSYWVIHGLSCCS